MNFSPWLLSHETQIRLTAFVLVFASLFVMQRLWPRRNLAGGWRRTTTNIALVVFDSALLRFAFPLLAFDLALRLDANDFGLLSTLPVVPGIVVGVLIMDLAIYWQHRLMHKVPILWRLHRVHHTDVEFDVSSGVRFHPLEIALSMAIKLGVIFVFGITPLAVLLFELALSTGSLFTHANLRLPAVFERRLRWLLVTPEMHRIHHSWYKDETDSNFSFHLSVWDRIFGSYRDRPRDGHVNMKIGLTEFRESRQQSLPALLANPFLRSTTQKPDKIS